MGKGANWGNRAEELCPFPHYLNAWNRLNSRNFHVISPRLPSPLELFLTATDNERLVNSPARDDPDMTKEETNYQKPENCRRKTAIMVALTKPCLNSPLTRIIPVSGQLQLGTAVLLPEGVRLWEKVEARRPLFPFYFYYINFIKPFCDTSIFCAILYCIIFTNSELKHVNEISSKRWNLT